MENAINILLIPIIIIVVELIKPFLTTAKLKKRWLPVIGCVAGLVASLAYYISLGDPINYFNMISEGLLAGLTAVGANSAIKNIKETVGS
jgi:hypothetical protein